MAYAVQATIHYQTYLERPPGADLPPKKVRNLDPMAPRSRVYSTIAISLLYGPFFCSRFYIGRPERGRIDAQRARPGRAAGPGAHSSNNEGRCEYPLSHFPFPQERRWEIEDSGRRHDIITS